MKTKELIQNILTERNIGQLINLYKQKKQVIKYLFRFLYSKDELLRHRAIEGLGMLCNIIALENPEKVRDILRRLWWSINEESGGIGWSAPEAMAEIIQYHPDLYSDFGPIIVSFLDEELLRRSTLWAAGTIGSVRPDLIEHAIPAIIGFLNDADPVLRGFAARALANSNNGLDKLELLKNDHAQVEAYENGMLIKKTVSQLAGAL